MKCCLMPKYLFTGIQNEYWVIFHVFFLLSADFVFENKYFKKNSYRNTIEVFNNLDPDQVQCFVGPDLGVNCLQRLLSADGISR